MSATRAPTARAMGPRILSPNNPKAPPTIKNPAAIAGQKSLTNLNIESTLLLFSGSENQSINLINALANTTLITASKNFCKKF